MYCSVHCCLLGIIYLLIYNSQFFYCIILLHYNTSHDNNIITYPSCPKRNMTIMLMRNWSPSWFYLTTTAKRLLWIIMKYYITVKLLMTDITVYYTREYKSLKKNSWFTKILLQYNNICRWSVLYRVFHFFYSFFQ